MSEKAFRGRSRSPLRPEDNAPKSKESALNKNQKQSQDQHEEIREGDLQPLSPASPPPFKPKPTFSKDQPYIFLRNIPKAWNRFDVKRFVMENTTNEYIIDSLKFIEMLKDFGGNACRILMSSHTARDQAFFALRGIYVNGERIFVESNPAKLTEPLKHSNFLEKNLQKKPSSYVPPNERHNDEFLPSTETYGLSTDFLNGLNIKPPLVPTVVINNANVPNFNEAHVRSVFGLAGDILNVHFFLEKNKIRITYDHPVEAVQAISMFNGQILHDSILKVRLDRYHIVNAVIPKGMQSIGPGLDVNGKPLRGVRAHVEISKLKKSLSHILDKPCDYDQNKNIMAINQAPSQDPWSTHTSQIHMTQPSQNIDANPEDSNVEIQMALAVLRKQNALHLATQSAQIISQIPSTAMNNFETNQPKVNTNPNFSNISTVGSNMNTNMPQQGTSFSNKPHAGPNMNANHSNMPPAGTNMNANIPLTGTNISDNYGNVPQANPNANNYGRPPQAGPNMNPNNYGQPLPAGPIMNPNNYGQPLPAGQNMNPNNFGQPQPAGSNLNPNNFGQPLPAGPNMNPNNFGQPLPAGPNMNPNNFGQPLPAGPNMNPNNYGQPPRAGAYMNTNFGNTSQAGMNVNTNYAGIAPPDTNIHTNYHNAPLSGANVNKNFTNQQQPGPNNFDNFGQPTLAKPSFIYDKLQNSQGQDKKDYPNWNKPNFEAKPQGEVLMFNNLPSSVTQGALSSKMREIGEVKMIEMTGKGQAIVRFYNSEDGKKCRSLFHHSRVDGKRIEVEFC